MVVRREFLSYMYLSRMLIGNGLLARRFSSYAKNDRYLVFAAGVSNSRTRDRLEFEREKKLLLFSLENNPGKIPIYFSTYSIYDPEEQHSIYVRHKLNMEKLIRETSGNYFILRVSNVVGKSNNPHTVLNYFHYHIKNQLNFDCWMKACRNLLDADDLYFIVSELLNEHESGNRLFNIGSPVSYTTIEIVKELETFLNKKANYVEVEKGSCFDFDLRAIQPILEKTGTDFDQRYLVKLLQKYF